MKTIRTIFVILLLMIGLQCAVSAQENKTCIKHSTAEYFLEADDERYLLRDKIIVLQNDSTNLKKEIFELRTIITTYKVDELVYGEQFDTAIGELENAAAEIERHEKKDKLERIVAVVLIVLALLL